MNLRFGTSSDARSIAVVHFASIRESYRGLFPSSALGKIDIDDRAERWRQLLTNAATATYVAESNGQILGFVNYGRCRDEDVADVRVGEIMSLYVAPDSWGNGLGRMLLGAALGQLAATGLCEAKLWVLGRNARAVAFYEQAGFVRDGTIKHRDMFGVPAIVVRYGTCLPK